MNNTVLSVEDMQKTVFSMKNQEYFTLGQVVNDVESHYPNKEIFIGAIHAYLLRLERFGMIEESRSESGLDKKYYWNNPFPEDKK